MAKPKAKTLQQKLGFFDDDLANPDHDAIMKWLDKNITKVISDLYGLTEWNKERVENLKKSVDKIVTKELENCRSELDKIDEGIKSLQKRIANSEKLLDERKDIDNKFLQKTIDKHKTSIEEKRESKIPIEKKASYLENFGGLDNNLPKRKPARIVNIKWEHAVTSQSSNLRTGYKSSKYIVGYVDMKVTFVCFNLIVSGIDFYNEKIVNEITWEQSEKKLSIPDETNTKDIFIEVKTKIKSLGSLFRQLRAYQEYEIGDFVVVCPDNSNRKIIEDQGFKFYKFK